MCALVCVPYSCGCVCVCTCVSLCACVCTYVHVGGVCARACVCVCVWGVRMGMCVCVSVGTCACVSVCACVCVCRCVLLSRIMRIPCSRVLSPCSAAPMLIRSVCLPESHLERKTPTTGHCEQSRLPSVGTSFRASLWSVGTGRPTPGQLVPTTAKQVHEGCCGPVAWPRVWSRLSCP